MQIISKISALVLALIFVLSPLCSCTAREEYQIKQIFAMDTEVTVYINASHDAAELLSECEELIYSIEDKISKTRSGSDVYRLNSGEKIDCNPITEELLLTAETVYDLSDGAFDPTVAGLVSMWKNCEKNDVLPTKDELALALSNTGFDKIRKDGEFIFLENGVTVDLGGIGKGYAEEAVAKLIGERSEKYGVRSYMIDFGGMVGVFGEKANGEKYKIGIKDPDDNRKSRGVVRLSSGFVSVSGDYERFVTVNGKKYHHIIDPKTGYPADSGIRSVAVVCDDGALADALSTALFVMGYDGAIKLYQKGDIQFEAVFFMKNGSTLKTEGADYSN